MSGTGLALPIVTMSEAQAYVRIETGEEEAVLAGLIRTASALCEAFINQLVIARDFTVDLPASCAWERLPVSPVRAITQVERVDSNGVETILAAESYATDIDSSGDGWVRSVQQIARTHLRVSGSAPVACEFVGRAPGRCPRVDRLDSTPRRWAWSDRVDAPIGDTGQLYNVTFTGGRRHTRSCSLINRL